MESVRLNYKIVKRIKDDRFSENEIDRYCLCLMVGTRDFQVAITDTSNNLLLLLEDYVISELDSEAEWLTLLRNIFEEHALLQARFWKNVRIGFKNNTFVQMPTALFDPQYAEAYLKFNAQIERGMSVLSYSDVASGITTLFGAPAALVDWLSGLYGFDKILYFHQSAVLIRGMLTFAHEAQEPSLFSYIDRFKIHVCQVQNGALRLYNEYPVTQFSDYVKYVLLPMKALSISQGDCHLTLWGYISEKTPPYQELRKYVRYVHFGPRPKHLNFGYNFDENQDHQFVDLYFSFLL